MIRLRIFCRDNAVDREFMVNDPKLHVKNLTWDIMSVLEETSQFMKLEKFVLMLKSFPSTEEIIFAPII